MIEEERMVQYEVLDEYIKEEAARSKASARDVQAGTPQIGVWWYDGLGIFGDLAPVRDGVDQGTFVVMTTSHLRLWSGYQRLSPILRGKDYTHFPRGRTIFDKVSRKFVVYSSKKTVQDGQFQKTIIKETSLPRENTEFREDSHY